MTKSEEVRIGVTVPSVNSVVEAWYPRAVPEHVSVHFARMLMPSDATPERIIEMDRTDGVRSIRQLASCRPHAIAYGCTASSIVQGREFDAHLRDEIREIAGCPGTSATTSIFAACAALRMQRVTAISPMSRRLTPRSTPSLPQAASKRSPTPAWASATAFVSPGRRPRKSWTSRSAPGIRRATASSLLALIFARTRSSRNWKREPADQSSPRLRQPCGTSCDWLASPPRLSATAGCCASIDFNPRGNTALC